MPKFYLKPFLENKFPLDISFSIEGDVEHKRDHLLIEYEIKGSVAALYILQANPQGTPPQRMMNLWQTTCFEFFLKSLSSKKYWEFNFSPSGNWNCFIFDDYRQGMRELPLSPEKLKDFICIETKSDHATFLRLKVLINLKVMGLFDEHGDEFENSLENDKKDQWVSQISTVLHHKDQDNNQEKRLTYWALNHEKIPDFHRFDLYSFRPFALTIRPLLILIGYRPGVLEVAKNYPYDLALFNQRISNSVQSKLNQGILAFAEECDFSLGPKVMAKEIYQRFKGREVAAVVALTEKAVALSSSLRELWNLPGIHSRQAELGRDKSVMKKKVKEIGIPTTPFKVIESKDEALALFDQWGSPVVLKEKDFSGGRSFNLCHSLEELQAFVRPGLLAEKYVKANELSVECFIQEGKVVFWNMTEYYVPRTVNILPANLKGRLGQGVQEKILQMNQKVIAEFGIERGMTHLEVYLTENGPLFGEIALRPPGGHIMDLLKLVYGQEAWDAVFQMELGHKINFSQKTLGVAASWILHPGPGIVERIEGLVDLQKIPEVINVKLKLKVGQKISQRDGAGDDTGRILFMAEDYQKLTAAVEKSFKVFKIHMLSPKNIESSKGGKK